MQWPVTLCRDLSLDLVTSFAAYITLGATRDALMELSNDEQSAGQRVFRRQQCGAWCRHEAPVLPEEVVCPKSVITGGATSTWYRLECTVAVLALTLASAGTAFADDPGFPAPTGDPAFVPPGAKLERLFDGGCILTEGVAAGHN